MKRYILLSIVLLLFLIALGFGLELIGLKWTRFIAPKKEAIRREVFEETRSFNESKKQDLVRYYHQWKMSKPENKEIIESTVRMMFADYDENKLPLELKAFLRECKY